MTDWGDWTPADLRDRLSRINKPWCVVGGWALDLWHGNTTRTHNDLEFCILRPDFDAFRTELHDFQLFAAKDGTETLLSPQMPAPATVDQFWGLDQHAASWAFDMMIDEGTAAKWVYKRNRQLAYPRRQMIGTTPDGIPYLQPAAVLLFKAKHLRPKDQFDFETAKPKLSTQEKSWLIDTLERCHPAHPWIAQLADVFDDKV